MPDGCLPSVCFLTAGSNLFSVLIPCQLLLSACGLGSNCAAACPAVRLEHAAAGAGDPAGGGHQAGRQVRIPIPPSLLPISRMMCTMQEQGCTAGRHVSQERSIACRLLPDPVLYWGSGSRTTRWPTRWGCASTATLDPKIPIPCGAGSRTMRWPTRWGCSSTAACRCWRPAAL